jgi:ADP-heptose:LPS heptosyltransferase
LDALGDVVLTGPFLRELRRNAPQAHITLVVQSSTFNLVELCPYVDEVLKFNSNSDRPGRARLAWRFLEFCVRHLWTRRWDIAINPRFDVDAYGGTLLLWLSRSRRRAGYSQSVTSEKTRFNRRHDCLLTDVIGAHTARHEVLQNMEVIRQLGGAVRDERLELWLSQADERVAQKTIERFGDATRSLCAIVPGAGEAKRMWPADYFAQVARVLCRDFNCNVLVIGGRDASAFGSSIEAEFPDRVVNTAGQMTVRQSAALLKRCELTITNDSGPMHLAAAAGSPVIEISCHPLAGNAGHSNSPIRFGPWGANHKVLQPLFAIPPCETSCIQASGHCIIAVSPEQVLRVVKEMLPQGIFSRQSSR